MKWINSYLGNTLNLSHKDGRFFIILLDIEDISKARYFHWRIGCDGYPETTIYLANGRKRSTVLRLHQLIHGPLPSDIETDHINGNKLDCRKSNLRQATRSQQIRNTGTYKSNKLGIKGVRFWQGNFEARIQFNKKPIFIGCFKTAKEASKAYKQKAKELFGAFARV